MEDVRVENVRSARLAIAAYLACLCACSREPASSADTIEGAGPETALHQTTLPEALQSLHAPDLELEGTWVASWKPGSDATRLELDALGPGRYAVKLWRTPDFGSAFAYQTEATWDSGGLALRGTDAHTRGTLYPARVAGEECLIPSGSLQLLPSGELWSAQAEHAFRREGLAPSVLRKLIEGELRELEPDPETEKRIRWASYYLPGPEGEDVPRRLGEED
jgi:hypothetical protein